MEDMLLATKKTIPLGLLVNEIAINALKHGFTQNQSPRFSVSMKETDKQNLEIKLSNSGEAFPEEIDIENPGTLGLQLIKSLVDQLNGSIDLQKEPHPVYTIRFPKQG